MMGVDLYSISTYMRVFEVSITRDPNKEVLQCCAVCECIAPYHIVLKKHACLNICAPDFILGGGLGIQGFLWQVSFKSD